MINLSTWQEHLVGRTTAVKTVDQERKIDPAEASTCSIWRWTTARDADAQMTEMGRRVQTPLAAKQ